MFYFYRFTRLWTRIQLGGGNVDKRVIVHILRNHFPNGYVSWRRREWAFGLNMTFCNEILQFSSSFFKKIFKISRTIYNILTISIPFHAPNCHYFLNGGTPNFHNLLGSRLSSPIKKNRTKNVRFTSILMSITIPFVTFQKARLTFGVAKLSREFLSL